MLQEEYDRLMELFQAAADGKSVDLDAVFQRALIFFEKLKDSMAAGTPEEKLQAIHLMSQMYQKLESETGKIAKNVGMTEAELADYAKNPENFDPKQWEQFQSAQEGLKHLGEGIVQEMKNSAKAPAQKKIDSGKKSAKDKGSKKADWFRT